MIEIGEFQVEEILIAPGTTKEELMEMLVLLALSEFTTNSEEEKEK